MTDTTRTQDGLKVLARWRPRFGAAGRGAVGLFALCGALTSALAAWACVPGASLAHVLIQPRSSGATGSTVSVEGLNFLPGTVEIRWNGLDGPALATTTGPSFKSRIEVPAVSAGLYILLVISRRPDGSVADIVRAPFHVTDDARAAPAPQHGIKGVAGAKQRGEAAWAVAAGAGGIVVGATAAAVRFGLRPKRRHPALPHADP